MCEAVRWGPVWLPGVGGSPHVSRTRGGHSGAEGGRCLLLLAEGQAQEEEQAEGWKGRAGPAEACGWIVDGRGGTGSSEVGREGLPPGLTLQAPVGNGRRAPAPEPRAPGQSAQVLALHSPPVWPQPGPFVALCFRPLAVKSGLMISSAS